MKIRFGKYRGREISTLPSGYLQWICDGPDLEGYFQENAIRAEHEKRMLAYQEEFDRRCRQQQKLLPKREKISKTKRSEVWDKTNGFCFYCGQRLNPFIAGGFAIDHYDPKGTDLIDNLFPSCRRCNTIKKNHPLEHFRTLMAPARFSEKQIEYLKSRGLKEEQFMPESFVFFFEKKRLALVEIKLANAGG